MKAPPATPSTLCTVTRSASAAVAKFQPLSGADTFLNLEAHGTHQIAPSPQIDYVELRPSVRGRRGRPVHADCHSVSLVRRTRGRRRQHILGLADELGTIFNQTHCTHTRTRAGRLIGHGECLCGRGGRWAARLWRPAVRINAPRVSQRKIGTFFTTVGPPSFSSPCAHTQSFRDTFSGSQSHPHRSCTPTPGPGGNTLDGNTSRRPLRNAQSAPRVTRWWVKKSSPNFHS